MSNKSRCLVLFIAVGVSAVSYGKPHKKPATSASETKQLEATDKVEGSSVKRVNINTASSDELKTALNVSDTTAKKIVDARPFAEPRQLVSRGIIKQNEYQKMARELIAKEPRKVAEEPPTKKQ